MTKDFIDDLIEVVEIKKAVNKSSKELFTANKANRFEIAGVEVEGKRQLSEEARQKISEGNKGKVLSDETKRKMSEARRKRTFISEETRQKLSLARKGKPHSEESKRKISEGGKGRVFTKEHRAKIGEANRARSEEVRRQISEGNKGKIVSDETKRKLSEAHKGKVLTEEHKKKIKEARKNRAPLSLEARNRISKKNKGRVRTEEQRKRMSEIAKLRDHKKPIMTPNGEFESKKSLMRRLVADGVLNPTEKLRTWFKVYPNDYFYISKNGNALVKTIDDKSDRFSNLDETVQKLLKIIISHHNDDNLLTVVKAITLTSIASKSTLHKNLAYMVELGLIVKEFKGNDFRRKYLVPTKLSLDYFKSK